MLDTIPDSAIEPIGTKQAFLLQKRCLAIRSFNLEGQFGKVFELYQGVFDELESDPARLDPDGQLRCAIMHSMAEAYASTGQFDSAVEFFHRANAFTSDSTKLPLHAHSDYEIALIDYERGDIGQALFDSQDVQAVAGGGVGDLVQIAGPFAFAALP